ncbi:GspH/FimT family pseudopilin [bacterium]|nr:GspH/FimT family pseudopilin [bacterium]
MIVLAIMGIMLVAAIPSFVQFTRNSRIKSGAQMVVSVLRTARSHAIKRRKKCAVLFNFNTDAHNLGYAVKIYWDPDDYDEGGSVTNWKTLPKTIIMTDGVTGGLPVYSPNGVPFPNDSDPAALTVKYIYFTPTGGASKTDGSAILISDGTHEDTSCIGITGITGRIKTSRE